MTLTPEQKQAVASWVAAGDNLSAVQKKLYDQFKVSLTYMDVRFLVDDLDLHLKDPAPKPSSNLAAGAGTGKPADKKGFLDKAKEKLGLGREEGAEPPADEALEDFGADGAASAVRVSVDRAVLIPGAVASGTVTFSDGVTGKWIVDQQGRPGFTEISQPGYRPTPADSQAFMQELGAALQQRGF